MDETLARILDYVEAFGPDELTPDVLDAARSHLVDTVAVAIAGARSEPALIATRRARTTRSEPAATVIGSGVTTTPELAAFANTIMVRTFDWNDGMLARSGGHPSDMVPGLIATAEVAGSSGRDLLVAMTLAYELLGGIGAECERGGFDQGLFMAPSTALACGRLLGLDRRRLAEAASLALVPNLPLGVSRWGELSMMKGATTAFAVRSGVFAALLAQDGFTSASAPFEGKFGLQHLTGPFTPHLPVRPDGPRVVQMSHQKPVPADTHALAVLDLGPQIRAFAPLDELDEILIEAPDYTVHHVADEPKYDPRTRETADHSLPFVLARYLVDGQIDLETYREDRVLDPELRPLMRRIRVTADPEFSELYRTGYDGVMRPTPRRVTVRRKDGQTWTEEITWHRGTYHNPMSRPDIDAKLASIADPIVGAERRVRIAEAWWRIDDAPDVRGAVETIADLAAEPTALIG